MKNFFQTLIDYILTFREWAGGYLGPALPWIEVLAVVLSAFFIWGFIYSTIASQWHLTRTDELLDFVFGGGVDVAKRRQLRIWRKIVAQIKSQNSTHWKQAILAADQIFDEILKTSGYRGATVHDRFKQLPPTAISNYDQLQAAHKIRDRIRQEADFVLSHAEAIEIIKVYEKAFKELGLID
jgi:hypothetical protein